MRHPALLIWLAPFTVMLAASPTVGLAASDASQQQLNGIDLSVPGYSDLSLKEKAALVDLNGPTFELLSESERALLEEYRSAYVRLRSFYNNVTMQLHEDEYAIPRSSDGTFVAPAGTPLKHLHIFEYVFRAREGGYFRLDGDEYDVLNPKMRRESRAAIITPDESYLLGRRPSSDVYYIEGRGKGHDRYAADMLSQYWFPHAALAFGVYHFEHLFLVNRFHYVVNSVESVSDGDDEIVRVSLSYRNDAERSTFDFYRRRCWAFKEGRVESQSSDPTRLGYVLQSCEYSGSHDGVPLITRCVVEKGARYPSADETVLARRNVYTVTKLEHSAPPLNDFDVAALVGPVGRQTGGSYFSIVSIVVSVVLVLVVLLVRRRRSVASA